jgi:hypothetical protein
LSAAELEACWTDLAGADAGRDLAVLSRLAGVPEQAAALLRDRLRPVAAPPPDELRRLLADLDSGQFARRETATKRLAELAETRRRAEGLLARPRLVRTPEARRALRAVRLLACIGSPETRQTLEKLARGAPEARLTREAQAALRRLARQAAAGP